MRETLAARNKQFDAIQAFVDEYGQTISSTFSARVSGCYVVLELSRLGEIYPPIRIDLSVTRKDCFLQDVARQAFEAGRNAKAAEICAALNIPAERMEKADG